MTAGCFFILEVAATHGLQEGFPEEPGLLWSIVNTLRIKQV